jgi:hypothetical protein
LRRLHSAASTNSISADLSGSVTPEIRTAIIGPPFAYLKDVLLRLATHPHRLLHQLTPRGWANTFGPSTGDDQDALDPDDLDRIGSSTGRTT